MLGPYGGVSWWYKGAKVVVNPDTRYGGGGTISAGLSLAVLLNSN